MGYGGSTLVFEGIQNKYIAKCQNGTGTAASSC